MPSAMDYTLPDRAQPAIQVLLLQPGAQRVERGVMIGQRARTTEQRTALGIRDSQNAAGNAYPLRGSSNLDGLSVAQTVLHRLETRRAYVDRQQPDRVP